MDSRAFWLISGVIVASVGALTVPRIVQQSVAGKAPAPELWWASYDNGVPILSRSSEISASVHLDTMGREVRVFWQWIPPSGNEFDVTVVEREYGTAFWPTASAALDSNRLLVGGRTLQGRTVLERWEFGPHVAATVGSGGEVSYELTPGARTSVNGFFTADQDGTRDVAAMVAILGNTEDILLVQFWDSQDLYEINASTGALSLVAGASQRIVIPELSGRKHKNIRAAEHVTAGYVYFLGEGEDQHSSVIALLDSDKNGVIDGHVVLDEAAWIAGNWSSPSNYVLFD